MRFETVRKKIIEIMRADEGKEYSTLEIVKLLGYKKTAYGWVYHVLECLEYNSIVRKIKKDRKVFWQVKQ